MIISGVYILKDPAILLDDATGFFICGTEFKSVDGCGNDGRDTDVVDGSCANCGDDDDVDGGGGDRGILYTVATNDIGI